MIQLKQYNYETKEYDNLGEVSSLTLAKSMSTEDFADFLDNYINDFSKGFNHGKEVGKLAQGFHRTLQRGLICELLGIIAGLSEQQHTDPRNSAAIASAKAIAIMLKNGELQLGRMV